MRRRTFFYIDDIFRRLKYTLQYDDDQLYLSGESIAEHSKDSPLINFIVELKEFIDADQNTGQEVCKTVKTTYVGKKKILLRDNLVFYVFAFSFHIQLQWEIMNTNVHTRDLYK